MSITLGAALKKAAVSFLLDNRSRNKIVCFILAVCVFVLAPGAGAAAMFSQTEFDLDTSQLATTIYSNLTPEDHAELQFMEDTGQELQAAMTAAGFTKEQSKAAEVLFVLALSDYAHDPGFVDKLVGCFAENQTDEELIAAVNTAFGTELSAEEFTAIMTYVNNQLVEIAKSQLGNVGGEPYWRWYGFSGRVEWCACFVSWCANRCGYIDRGVCPKFSSCSAGVNWFKNRSQWQDASVTPVSGMVIFFDWNGNNDPDHVGIVEKVEDGRVYTIEGNNGDSCRRCSYPVGYNQIFGYGVLAA